MRDPVHTATHLHTLPSPSPSPSPYPVSIRAYKKKDYDYLSSFPRMGHSVLRTTRTDAELLQERSDCDSDISMTASSVGYTTSNSSTSSTISAQSYAKSVIVAVDAEANHHHQQQQQHQHPFLSTRPCEHLPRIAMDCAELGIESNNNKIVDRSSAIVKEDDKSNITPDSAAPIDKAPAQVKVPGQSQLKPKPKPSNAPAVLPKFGSWDTRNPSSGDSYTLIFRRLRDEKKSGGLPICTSPTASKEEGSEESLSQESKPKEPLHPNAQMRRDSSRQKGKGKSRQEAAYTQKNATRWTLCCKASVLDD